MILLTARGRALLGGRINGRSMMETMMETVERMCCPRGFLTRASCGCLHSLHSQGPCPCNLHMKNFKRITSHFRDPKKGSRFSRNLVLQLEEQKELWSLTKRRAWMPYYQVLSWRAREVCSSSEMWRHGAMSVFYTGEFYTVSLLQDADRAGGCQAAGRTCLVLCFVFVG